MRNITFGNDEYYHVYNHAVEQRDLFVDIKDYVRFLESMTAFNTVLPVGSLYELSFQNDNHLATTSPSAQDDPLVEIIAYCLNPNHFHLILKQIADEGVSKFMKRLAGGYSWYFNNRHKRKGRLYQGPFGAKHINGDDYLLRLSVYVNLNDQVHQLGDHVAKYGSGVSSWGSYVRKSHENDAELGKRGTYAKKVHCKSDVILGQFLSQLEYEKFAEETLRLILEQKELGKELARLSFD